MDSHIACPAPRSFYDGRRYVVLGLVLGALFAAIFPASAGARSAILPGYEYTDSFLGADHVQSLRTGSADERRLRLRQYRRDDRGHRERWSS